MFSWLRVRPTNRSVRHNPDTDPESLAAGLLQEAMYLHQQALKTDHPAQDQVLLSVVSLYENCLQFFTETHTPEQWARINGLLGGVFGKIPTGAHEADSKRAIGFYMEALRVYREELYPAQWAATQMLLGGVYVRLLVGDRTEHLSRAIGHYNAALRVWTESISPHEWATAQASLGDACRMLGALVGGTYFYRAIECYLSAQRVWTREAFSIKWAEMQQNLASTYQDIPDNQGCNIKAIECAQAALDVFTKSAHPARWAMVQVALARAYAKKSYNSSDHLSRAISHCRGALTVFTESEFPIEWALTQTILGISLSGLAEEHSAGILDEALSCFDSALRIYREDSHPNEWANVQFSYGIALANQANQHAASREANLGRAIACFEEALRIWSEHQHPSDWAKAKTNLGTAHLTVALGQDEMYADDQRSQHLQISVACYQAALRVITQETMPLEWALIQTNLPRALAELSSDGIVEEPKRTVQVTEHAIMAGTQPKLSHSTILFLRPFWDSDTTAAQLGALASALHDVKSIVALRNGREGNRRWWLLAGSQKTVLPNNVRLVPSSRRRWQKDAIHEILNCDVVVVHLAPKDLKRSPLPIPSVDRFVRDPRGPYVTEPIHESGIGEGLLRELAYCRQTSFLDRTVVVLPAAFEDRVSQMLEILHHTPIGSRFYLLNHEDGSESALPRMTAADRALEALQHVHAVIPYVQFGDNAFNEALRNALASCLSTPVTPGPRPLLYGIPSGPIALPPDWTLKWIRFTRLELLIWIPPNEIVELSTFEVRLFRPGALKYFKVCHGCGRGRKTMFFYQRGLNLTQDAPVHMDCQYCGFRDYY